MSEAAIDKAGDEPLEAGLERIGAMKSKDALPAEVAWLHARDTNVFFAFGSSPDADNSKMTIADVDQGGLGLPDRSYYLDAKDEEMRTKYREHIARMFELIGDSKENAAQRAKAVLEIETALAKASLDRVSRRNPQLTHHKMTLADFSALDRHFDFKRYFAETRAPQFDSLNVSVPDFFKALNQVVSSESLDDLKSYLTWHYVSAYASYLSKPFVEENFDFYQHFLAGTKELAPRWKRCVRYTDRSLGDALGQKYVARAFGGQSKEKTQELVAIIEKKMAADIDSLPWMSAATKQQALAKLKGVTNKIGYPEKWKDYSTIHVTGDNLVANVAGAREYENGRDQRKIGKPVDRTEFYMTAPTVNAYYNPLENNINFPAGILQPPFYQSGADMAVNFGGVGAVIGHELTHGFDDQGRQFDADGNLRDWWTKQDDEEFRKRVDCIANEYSQFSPVEGLKLNGRLTLGEIGADNAGVRLAFMALLGGLEDGSINKEKLDGYTPQQRFFLGYAQIWCQNQRPESLRNGLRTNPHSPGEFRVNGVLQNAPEFSSAFGCSAGQPMVSANACRVW
jgi:endothelin-converting enzyme/putative endopeptidase